MCNNVDAVVAPNGRPKPKPLSDITNGRIAIASSSKTQLENVSDEKDDEELSAIEKGLDTIWGDRSK